jgi:hypothetical protein
MIRKTFCALGAMLLVSSGAGASDIRRVVTGLDANNKSVVMFDNRMPLQSGPLGLSATNLWVTSTYPLGFSFKDDTSAIPVGVSPLDNGTKFRVVGVSAARFRNRSEDGTGISDEDGWTRCAGARSSGDASLDAPNPQRRLCRGTVGRGRYDAR